VNLQVIENIYIQMEAATGFEKTQLVDCFQRHRNEIHQFLLGKLRDRNDADDVLQDTYLKVAEMDSRRVEMIRDPKGYIFRIANNLVIDLLRSRSRHDRLYQDTSDIDDAHTGHVSDLPDGAMEEKQLADLLRAAIASMPPTARQVFLLYRFKGLSKQDIATELNMSKHAVEKNVVRALKHCRDFLKRGEQ